MPEGFPSPHESNEQPRRPDEIPPERQEWPAYHLGPYVPESPPEDYPEDTLPSTQPDEQLRRSAYHLEPYEPFEPETPPEGPLPTQLERQPPVDPGQRERFDHPYEPFEPETPPEGPLSIDTPERQPPADDTNP
jgi:hypothetical protein